jgi:hypothetical protein
LGRISARRVGSQGKAQGGNTNARGKEGGKGKARDGGRARRERIDT